MLANDIAQTETSLERTRKICKVIYVIAMILLVLFCAFLLLLLAMTAMLIVSPDMVPIATIGDNSTFLNPVLYDLVIIAILIIVSRLFKDVSKGESPFASVQVRRMRLMALLLLIYAIIEVVLSQGFSSLVQTSSLDVGYVVDSGSGTSFVSVNLGALCTSAVVFCFSFVFEYGVLLQQLSDETL